MIIYHDLTLQGIWIDAEFIDLMKSSSTSCLDAEIIIVHILGDTLVSML